MKLNYSLLFFAIIISGCTTFYELEQVNSSRYFQLDKTYLRIENKGLGNNIYVFGLKSGIYKEIAIDKLGSYFLGSNKPVIVLKQKNAEEYLKRVGVDASEFYIENGGKDKIGRVWISATLSPDIPSDDYPYVPSAGGLYVPNKNNNDIELVFSITLSQEVANTGGLIVSELAGSIEDYDFKDEKDLISNIKIHER